jgi:hypothetical protein
MMHGTRPVQSSAAIGCQKQRATRPLLVVVRLAPRTMRSVRSDTASHCIQLLTIEKGVIDASLHP